MRASTEEAKELLTTAMSRIRGVGIIQDELYKNVDDGIELGNYLASIARTVLDVESERPVRLATKTEPLRVKFEDASNFGLIVNELVTNAIKHGGEKMTEVRLEVLRAADGNIRVCIGDNGNGFEDSVAFSKVFQNSRGTNLIDALAKRLHGQLIRLNDAGATIILTCPLPS